MKRAVILIAAGLLLACLPVFAQSQANSYPKDAYVKSVHILKIWAHPLGYMVQFFSSKSTVAEIYVPLAWFNQGPASRADLIYGNDREYPYFSVFWIDGKFDHINLFVLNDFGSLTWGVLETVTDRSAKFNVQDVPREF